MTRATSAPPTAYNNPPYMRKLDVDECRHLLAGQSMGRIGFMADGLPTILPVNYVLAGNLVAVRTGPGLKLDHAPLNTVAFQIDDFDPSRRTGWSVLVRGPARVLPIGPLRDEVMALPLVSWAPGPKEQVLTIFPKFIEGRRLWRDPDPRDS